MRDVHDAWFRQGIYKKKKKTSKETKKGKECHQIGEMTPSDLGATNNLRDNT